MDKLTAALLILFMSNKTDASIKDAKTIEVVQENQIWLTDRSGFINPNTIIKLAAENEIRIYTSDGEKFDGVVKTVKYENDILKIFGDIKNKSNSAFGFGITKGGAFAGAIFFKDEEYTYVVELSEKDEAFVFVKKSKNDKKQVATK